MNKNRSLWVLAFLVSAFLMASLGMIRGYQSAQLDNSAIQKGDECRIGQGEWFPSIDGVCYASCEHGSWTAECWSDPPKKHDVRMLIDFKSGRPVITTTDPLSLDTNGSVLPLYTSTGLMMIDKKSLDLMLKDHPEARLQIVVYEEDEHGNMVRAREPECLARMEAAMRAIDPYLGKKFGNLMKKADQQPYLKALDQWIATTNECWRQP